MEEQADLLRYVAEYAYLTPNEKRTKIRLESELEETQILESEMHRLKTFIEAA